ncbi:hypothetical protein HDU88_006145 [Geranomyces variabilis]|nr:hypothetical protein HDU88_006145 [Geranomyces variabilis]
MSPTHARLAASCKRFFHLRPASVVCLLELPSRRPAVLVSRRCLSFPPPPKPSARPLANSKLPPAPAGVFSHTQIAVISATGTKLGTMTYQAACGTFDSTTHELRLVNARQDPPVYRVVQRLTPSTRMIVIGPTGANLGEITYAEALKTFDRATHELSIVNAKDDLSVYRVVQIVADGPRSTGTGGAFVKPLKNEKITAAQVRVVWADSGKDAGVMPLAEALKLFPRRTHDLLLENPDAAAANPNVPPTCRIVSHEAQQKARQDSRKKPGSSGSQTSLKEIEVGSTISSHDLSIKIARARTFLLARHRVKVTVVDKKNRKSREVLRQIVDELKDLGKVTDERESQTERKLMADIVPVPIKTKK